MRDDDEVDEVTEHAQQLTDVRHLRVFDEIDDADKHSIVLKDDVIDMYEYDDEVDIDIVDDEIDDNDETKRIFQKTNDVHVE